MCDDNQQYAMVSFLLEYQRHFLIPLSGIAAIVNASFFICVLRGCYSEDVPIKRFLFVLNRSAVDLAASLVTMFYLIKSLLAECEDDSHGCTKKETVAHPLPLQAVISLDFWNVALSYSGVALLTVYAVHNPIKYKTVLSVRHVMFAIAGGWLALITVLAAIYAKLGIGASFDTNGMIYIMLHGYFPNEISYWHSDLCTNINRQTPVTMAGVSLSIPIFLLLLAVASYGLVARALCYRQPQLHQSALLRLGMHLVVFSATVLLMGITYVAAIPMQWHCNNPNSCGVKPLWIYSLLSAASSVGWFLRMTLDPAIDVMVDGSLRRSVFNQPRHRLSTATVSTREDVTSQRLLPSTKVAPLQNHKLSMTVSRCSAATTAQASEALLAASRV